MRHLDLISRSRADKKKPYSARGFVSSFLLHSVFICLAVELSILCQANLPLSNKGSVAGAPVISLETLVIVSSHERPAPPSPALRTAPDVANVFAPRTPATVSNPALRAMPPEPVILPHPEIGVPVLAGQRTNPLPAMPAKTGAPVHQAAVIASTGGGIGHLRPADEKFVSSYADGLSVLPHPPYPPEARDLQETGIVRMLVQFDKAGNVARADVAGSSGVAVLDAETRDFIRSNWHSSTYAGRAVSVPVAYTLTSL